MVPDVLHYHRGRRTVALERDDTPAACGLFTIRAAGGEVALSAEELEWLCHIAGPAQLVRHRQAEAPAA